MPQKKPGEVVYSIRAVNGTTIGSCELCSRRHKRCDRLYPTCTRCKKAGVQCSLVLMPSKGTRVPVQEAAGARSVPLQRSMESKFTHKGKRPAKLHQLTGSFAVAPAAADEGPSGFSAACSSFAIGAQEASSEQAHPFAAALAAAASGIASRRQQPSSPHWSESAPVDGPQDPVTMPSFLDEQRTAEFADALAQGQSDRSREVFADYFSTGLQFILTRMSLEDIFAYQHVLRATTNLEVRQRRLYMCSAEYMRQRIESSKGMCAVFRFNFDLSDVGTATLSRTEPVSVIGMTSSLAEFFYGGSGKAIGSVHCDPADFAKILAMSCESPCPSDTVMCRTLQFPLLNSEKQKFDFVIPTTVYYCIAGLPLYAVLECVMVDSMS